MRQVDVVGEVYLRLPAAASLGRRLVCVTVRSGDHGREHAALRCWLLPLVPLLLSS